MNVKEQKNIDTMNYIADELMNGKKISEVLKLTYSKRNVQIPFDDELFNTPLLDLKLSNRIINALMRNRLKSISEVIEFKKTNSFANIQGLGKQSATELLETILDLAWDRMDEDKRFEFLTDVVERNESYLIV